MRMLLAFIINLCPMCTCAVAEFDPFTGPKPIAVFIQTNPWARVINADTPRVAIYENGDLIFVRTVNDRPIYYHVLLKKSVLDKVRQRIKPVLELKDLKPRYDLKPFVTDQPEAMFYLRDGKRKVATRVYGMAAGTDLSPRREFANGASPIVPPDELLELYRWFCSVGNRNSKEWIPKYVEVILWDYSHASEASLVWPDEWPSLDSDRAVKRGNSYSLFLDGSMLPQIRDFLETRNDRGAVEIDGKWMSVEYRLTFPREPDWRKAFAAARQKQINEKKQGDEGGN
jgi:hypothetical protein